MAGDEPDFAAMLADELRQRVAQILLDNPSVTPEAAALQAQGELLKNNPWIPPAHGCPVNDLPPELLAHIFHLGRQMYEEEEDYGSDYEDEGVDLGDEWETDEEDEDGDVHMESPVKRAVPLKVVDDEEDSDDDEEEDDEEDDEPDLAFQVLVSHVCRHWREIALGTHTLWTTLQFSGHLKLEKAQAWIERANGLPLDIFIDCTIPEYHVHDHDHDHEHDPEQEPPPPLVGGAVTASNVASNGFGIFMTLDPATNMISTSTFTGPIPFTGPISEDDELEEEPCLSLADLIIIMDLITPHVKQWHVFEVTVNYYSYMHEVLQRLALCESAPLLEEFGLYNYEDGGEYEEFLPAELAGAFLPFHGIAPKLTNVALWGTYLAWEESLSFLQGLREIEFAYHAKDVRPSFAVFKAILTGSPDLQLLSLCLSGPAGDDWFYEVMELPTLRSLVLCYHEHDYAQALVRSMALPALEELTLDYHNEDFTEFTKMLAGPATGQSRSLLAGLTSLKITGLPCNEEATNLLMAQLGGLKNIDLNCEGEEERYFERLGLVVGKRLTYCPKLESLRTAGIKGTAIRKVVAVRKAAGAPLNRVMLSERDFVEPKDEKWLRANVPTFDFFEPSDSEEELVDMEDEDTDDDQ